MDVRKIIERWAADYKYDPTSIRYIGKGQPQLIIFGENHAVHGLKDEQCDLAARVQCETMLHEALGNFLYHPKLEIVRRNPMYPHRELEEKFLEEYLWLNAREGLCPEYNRWKKEKKRGILLNKAEEKAFSELFYRNVPHFSYFVERIPPRVNAIVGCDIDWADKWYWIQQYEKQGIIQMCDDKVIYVPEFNKRREKRMGRGMYSACTLLGRHPIVSVVGWVHMRRKGEEGGPSFHNSESEIYRGLGNHFPFVYIKQSGGRTYREYVKKEIERLNKG